MSRSESDEEAAGGCELLSLSLKTSADGVPNIGGIAGQLGVIRDSLSELLPVVPELVSFEVEDKIFTVHRRILEKDPQSILFYMANSHFRNNINPCSEQRKRKRDENIHEEAINQNNPIVIAGRSAEVFSRLLNFLRGYKNCISLDWLEICEKEAVFYGLQRSWYSYFPEISRQCLRLFDEPRSTDSLHSDCLCIVIGHEMEYGQQHVDLSCFGDNVGVGVVRCLPNATNSNSLQFCNGIFCCSDGKIRSCDSDGVQRLLSNERESDKTHEIRISYDADDAIVRWDRLSSKDPWCIGIRRLSQSGKYRFGIIASQNSRVFIKS